jgi:hypothetical protein
MTIAELIEKQGEIERQLAFILRCNDSMRQYGYFVWYMGQRKPFAELQLQLAQIKLEIASRREMRYAQEA